MTERTDRELLELAAKAAGIYLEWDGPMELWQPMYYEGKTYHAWDPLLDDGDALRLAVSCDMTVCADGSATVSASSGYGHARLMATMAVSECGDNKNSAVRRAIVRVAAAMAEGGEHG